MFIHLNGPSNQLHWPSQVDCCWLFEKYILSAKDTPLLTSFRVLDIFSVVHLLFGLEQCGYKTGVSIYCLTFKFDITLVIAIVYLNHLSHL